MSKTNYKYSKSAFEYLLTQDPRVKVKYDAKPFWTAYDYIQSKFASRNFVLKNVDWSDSHEQTLSDVAPSVVDAQEGKSLVITTDSSITRGITFGEPIKLLIAVSSKEDLNTIKEILSTALEPIVAKGIYSKITKLNYKRMNNAEEQGIKSSNPTYKYYELPIKLSKVPKAVKK